MTFHIFWAYDRRSCFKVYKVTAVKNSEVNIDVYRIGRKSMAPPYAFFSISHFIPVCQWHRNIKEAPGSYFENENYFSYVDVLIKGPYISFYFKMVCWAPFINMD